MQYNYFKRTVLVCSMLVTTIVLFAGPIDKETAKLKVQSFLSKEGNRKMKGVHSKVLEFNAVKTTFESSFYVFNVGQDDGFVIVSANDQTESILGYVDEGSFAEDSIPENMKAWLQYYQEEISRINDVEEVQTESSDNKETIEPLITTRWDQSTPYNYECHLGIIDSYALTGCVATTMAQIMNYHQWPKTTSEEIPAYTMNYSGYGSKEWEAQPIYSFDWDNMKNTYTGSESTTDVSAIAVAKLMRYCGQSVSMRYSNISSSASAASIPNALKKYFGYDSDLIHARRSSYTIQGWEDLIYNELKNKRPVIYSGQSASGGHGFICDGYDENGLFHINWGWSGRYDGFFRLSVLNYKNANANPSGEGYSMSQEAIIGIMPENNITDTYVSGDNTGGTVSIEATIAGDEEVTVGSNNNYTIQVTNTGNEYNGSLYVFVNSEKKSSIGVAIAAGGTETIDVSLVFVSEGEHTITVCTDSNGNNVITSKTIKARIAEEIINGLIANIEVSGAQEVDGELVVYSSSVAITYSFTNVTDSTYSGKFNILYGNGSPTQGYTITVTLPAKQTYTRTINLNAYYGMTLVVESQSTPPSQPDGAVSRMKRLTVKLVKPEETGINDVQAEGDKHDVYYSLRGVKIGKPSKPDVYIQNGKKIIVK